VFVHGLFSNEYARFAFVDLTKYLTFTSKITAKRSLLAEQVNRAIAHGVNMTVSERIVTRVSVLGQWHS